ncbi:unnamed protein product [Kuraishia capsulata CBS 1993]|uniref:Ubiquitin-like domain-containing protein n=1 Tax=Kuraishia capsulata CBS 1993 TaxID=1382522 RepID=W6MRJ0_9ASCO|nr:uncharacterized protein KUCA_T00004964001 [Kuraishia capsulata CBS 1993]CDK28978.1 unnamed protein product [Kuraishia capsulata CBS 1993]
MSDSSEKDAAIKLLYLLSVTKSDIKFPDHYVQELKTVNQSAHSYQLSPYDYPAQKRPDNTQSGRSINLTVKSIRPPRFTATVSASSKDLVYNVKKQLVQSVPELKDIHESQLKLMLKTKVLPDTTTLGSHVPDGEDALSLMVMVGKLEAGAENSSLVAAEAVTPNPEKASKALSAEAMDVDLKISETAWSKVYAILEGEISDKSRLDAYFEKIKSLAI